MPNTRKLTSRASFVALISLLLACPFARADQYQEAIAKAFPGFQIMSRSEFHPEIQKYVKDNPALITGRFNNDDLEDFAAIIRSDVKKQSSSGKTLYDGKFVVCHRLRKEGYACQQLGTGAALSQDFNWYLHRVEPGVSCEDDDGKKIVAKRDSIGTREALTAGGSVWINRSDGTYSSCSGD